MTTSICFIWVLTIIALFYLLGRKSLVLHRSFCIWCCLSLCDRRSFLHKQWGYDGLHRRPWRWKSVSIRFRCLLSHKKTTLTAKCHLKYIFSTTLNHIQSLSCHLIQLHPQNVTLKTHCFSFILCFHNRCSFLITNTSYFKSVAKTIFGAVFIYIAFFVFCGSQLWIIKRQSKIRLWTRIVHLFVCITPWSFLFSMTVYWFCGLISNTVSGFLLIALVE